MTSTTSDPAQLHAALVDHIRRRGTFHTPQVETAFLTVPRHLFLPGVPIEKAYAPQVVVTKRADDGTALSSASQPNLVAAMLEQLDVRPGQRVLEIGAATGINAALLAELTGPKGEVVTLEIDDDLAAGARTGLAAAGYDNVTVLCADGADGYPARAPYDRIIVTAGAWDLAPAWWDQLALGGRIVIPLVLHSSGLTRSITFDRTHPDHMVSTSALVCGFVGMRGSIARTHHRIALTDDLALQIDSRVPIDKIALRHALTTPAHEHWTGIHLHDDQPVEHLDLWLATTATGFGRLSAGQTARDNGVAAPALRWAGAALYDDTGTVAYLALRGHNGTTDELGVIAHGPDSQQLAATVADQLRRWDHQRPDQPTVTAHPAGTPDYQLPSGHRIDKPATRLTISW